MTQRYLWGAMVIGLTFISAGSMPASAGMGSMTQPAIAMTENSDLIQVQRRAYRGGTVYRGPRNNVYVNRNVYRGPRNNVYVNRNVAVVNRGLYRGGYVYRGGPWVRPRSYWWPVGGAVAAGAALGMIAASSAAWAGPAPGPGYCWYYTDPSQRQGFWDQCY